MNNSVCKTIAAHISTISPRLFYSFAGIASLVALSGALLGQYGFGLHPCDLCLYQRIPFALIIFLSLCGVTNIIKQRMFLYVTITTLYLMNSGIALFHSGVERKWWIWDSGCTTPDMSGSIADIIERIKLTAVVRCDEIPWSLFGLSMANYNVVYCLGIAVLCGAYITLQAKAAKVPA